MIKILFFIEALSGGGAEKVLLNLVNAMDKSKFDITVQTLFPDESAKHLDPAVRYKYCYKSASKIGNLRMRAEAEIGLTYSLHIKGDYDIEVAYLECGSTKIMSASTNKKATKLAWVHCDLRKKAGDVSVFVRKTEKYYKKFDKIVCVSNDARNSFIEMYGNSPEAVTVYNCYNDREIKEKAELPIETEISLPRPLLLAVGRLSEEKCFDRLLRVQKRLLQEKIDFSLLILGEGKERENLEKYISENSLEGHVELPGFCENPYQYIKYADLLVCSSRYEGYSTFAVEGLILGKPMITTECGGMKELLQDGKYGMITENSEEGLYQGIKLILTEKDIFESLQKNVQCNNMFSLENSVEKTEEFFESFIKQR